MTREEQINILIEARDRALKQIDLTEGHEMGTEEFQRLIYCAEQLRWMAQCHEDSVVPEPEQYYEPVLEQYDEPEAVLPKVHSERVGNLIVSEVVQPEPEPGESKYSMTDVRAALAKARSKGINVADIIRSFGVENFQQIDASKYPAIMEKLEVATNAT